MCAEMCVATHPLRSFLFLLLLCFGTSVALATDPDYVTCETNYAPYYGVDVENDVVFAVSYGVTNDNGMVHAYRLYGGGLELLDAEPVPGARKVKVLGSRVHVLYSYYQGGLWRSGLNIYDYSGGHLLPYDTGLYWTGKSVGFDVDGSVAAIPVENDKLMLIDISDPETPSVLGNYSGVTAGYDVQLAVDKAYLANGPDGLDVLDISTPTNMTWLGGFFPADSASVRSTLLGPGGHTYSVGEGFWVVDLTVPLLPDLLDSEPHDAVRVDAGDGLIHIAGDGGYTQFDCTDPSNIVFTGSYITGSQGEDVCYESPYIYLADRTGLYVLQNGDAVSTTEVTVTMHSLTAEAIANLIPSFDTEMNAVPMVPVHDRTELDSLPQVTEGLVADGVTPLLIKLEAPSITGTVTGYWSCAVNDTGGSVDGGLYPRMGTWTWISWSQADSNRNSRTLIFEPSVRQNFVVLQGLDPWDLHFAPGTNELELCFRLLEEGTDEPLASDLHIRLRRPPVALLSYGISNRWGSAFLDQFTETRPDDFVRVFPDTWSDALMRNTYKALSLPPVEPWTELLDWISADLPGAGWALTRIDCVAHSTAGLAIRDLCRADYPVSPTTTFRDEQNHYRGWFHRLVTVGTPHRGTRLIPYLDGLITVAETIAPELFMILPEKAFHWEPIREGGGEQAVLMYLEPDSEFIRSVNLSPDPGVKAHTVFTRPQAEQGPVFQLLGLQGDRRRSVLPYGSDGIIDGQSSTDGRWLKNMSAGVFEQPDAMEWWDLTGVAGEIAHCKTAADFGANSVQIGDAAVGNHTRALLDTESAVFSSFPPAPPVSESELAALRAQGSRAALQILIDIVLDETAGPGLNASVVTCSLDPPPEAPLSGEVLWVAEVYGKDGVSSAGVTVTPNPSDSTHVTVEVADSVVGDVILFASYLTPENELVFARPFRVYSAEPAGASPTGIDVEPVSLSLSVGDTVRPQVWRLYDDGSRLRCWVTTADVSVACSAPAVVSVSNQVEWLAVGEGAATTTVSLLGFEASSRMDVSDPFPPQTFAGWREMYFSEDELTNVLISGPDADGEPDGLTLMQEYCFGGHPHLVDAESRLRIELRRRNGTNVPAVICRMSTTAADVELSLQQCSRLVETGWHEFYNVSLDPDLLSPLVLDCADGGTFMDLVLAHTTAVPAQAFYRTHAIGPPGPVTNALRITSNRRDDTYPEWHPWTNWIAYITDNSAYPGAPNLGMVVAGGSDERMITSGPNSGQYGLVRSLCWGATSPFHYIIVEERYGNHEFLAFNTYRDGFRRTQTDGPDFAFHIKLNITVGALGICSSRDQSTVMWRVGTHDMTSGVQLRVSPYSTLGGAVYSHSHGTAVLTASGETAPLVYWGFALTPDGSQAIVTRRSGEGRDLFLYNTDGTGTPVQLTTTGQDRGAFNDWPDVSPDGKQIAFAYSEPGNHEDLAVIGIDGRLFWNVTQTPDISESSPTWSPDGAYLAAHRYDTAESGGLGSGESPNYNIYVYNLSAAAP